MAIKLVNAAGKNGAVVLNFTPPEALLILQAAQKLNLEDNVKYWACSTPCNTDFLAKSLGPKWNSKLFVNAELTPPDGTNTPTMNLYKAILKQYGSDVSGGIGSFSQMGFVEAELAVQALETITGRVHGGRRSTPRSRRSRTSTPACSASSGPTATTACTSRTTWTTRSRRTTASSWSASTGGGCTLISADDPQIAQYVGLAGRAPADPTSLMTNREQ